MAYQARGEIFRLPGMPPMYDYEHLPQDVRPWAEPSCSRMINIKNAVPHN